MPSNSGAWQMAPQAHLLEIKPSTYRSPNENEILIRSRAIAINPADWILQRSPPPIQYPVILGEDVAGEVIEVGTGTASRFTKGDRVVGFANGIGSRDPTQAAFQEYVILKVNVVARIPSAMSFEDAAVLPLGMATAAAGIFPKDRLALPYPTLSPIPTGKTVLVWGGASSVGSNAIQLLRAAGCETIATASSKNFEYVKKLGASQVLDYKSDTVIDDIVTAFEGRQSAGALACAPETVEACVAVVRRIQGRKFIVSAGFFKDVVDDVEVHIMNSYLFVDDLGLGRSIMEEFLPEALATGKYLAAPGPQVVGRGLENVQTALDIGAAEGVSAKKLVVTL